MSLIISLQSRKGVVSFKAKPRSISHASSRKAVTSFSIKSSARIRRYLSCCVADYRHLGTLTYPEKYPVDGKDFKRDLAVFIKRLRRESLKHVRRDDEWRWSIFWFLEFQERGAPHFHFFTTSMPGKTIEESRHFIKHAWFEVVNSGDPKHLLAGTQFDNMRTGRGGTISYAVKYARKASQKKVPHETTNVGRFWGVSGCRRTVSADIIVDDAELLDKNCRLHIKKYLKLIYDYEKKGEVDICRDQRGRIRWFYMKTEAACRELSRKIETLKISIGLESGIVDFCGWMSYDHEPEDLLVDEDYLGGVGWHYHVER